MFKILYLFLLLSVGAFADDHPIPRLIISPWAFFDVCDDSDPFNTSKMSGIEYNVVRDAFKIAGYEEGVDFIFECLPWPDCTDAVYYAEEEDNVLGLIEALPVLAEDLAEGYYYSQSTLQIGFGVGYFQNATDTNGIGNWFFVKPFTTSLYLVMMILPVVFAALLWYFEQKNMPFLNYLFHLIIYYFKLDFLKKLNAESRIIEFIFQIYCMVVILTYTSMMVDTIAVAKANGVVQTPDDLRGLRMTTDVTYVDLISAVNGRPVDLYQPGDPTTVEEFIVALERQDVAYYLFENPIIEALAAADCRFSVVLTNVIQTNFGILWSKFAPQEMKDKIDIALVQAYDEKNRMERTAEGIQAASSQQCLTPRSNTSKQIVIDDVYGLWIIWCICFGVAIIAKLLSYCKKKNGRPLFNIYDLELRGPREQYLIGNINSQTTCLALVSKDMIRKIRQHSVETYNDCFNMIGIPQRARRGLLAMIETSPDFQQLMEAILNEPLKLKVPTGPPDSSPMQRLGNLFNKKKASMPDVVISFPPSERLRSPSAPAKPSKRISEGNNRINSPSGGNTPRPSADVSLSDVLSPKKRERMKTKMLVSNLNKSLLSYNANSPKALFNDMDKKRAKDLADYYHRKSIDLETELKGLKSETDNFTKQFNAIKNTKKNGGKTPLSTFNNIAFRSRVAFDRADEADEPAQEIRAGFPQSINIELVSDRAVFSPLNESGRELVSKSEYFPSKNEYPLTVRSYERVKDKTSKFSMSPAQPFGKAKQRICYSPAIYKVNNLKQFNTPNKKPYDNV